MNENHLLCLVLFIASVMTMIGLYVRRTSPLVKSIVIAAIMETERVFNSGQGQEKLEFATMVIKSKLPSIASVFVTKRMIVSMIETTLNKVAKTFEVDKIVDIVGNENTVSSKK